MKPTSTQAEARARGRAVRTALAAFAAVSLAATACNTLDDALNVDAPGRLPGDSLDDPTYAPLLVSGAVADFDCALGSFVVMGGLVTDELIDATQTADRWPYDRRNVQSSDGRYGTSTCENLGVYTPIATARWSADNALAKLQGWTDAQMPAGTSRAELIAVAAAYSAYSRVLLGEMFCTAAIDTGPELTSRQILEQAEERFGQAIDAATVAGDQSLLNMSFVGRARVRLDLSQYDASKKALALADAQRVPADFVRSTTASSASSRRENRVFSQNNTSQNVTVDPAFRGLAFGGVADPRVRVTDTGKKATDGQQIWIQNKYAGLTSGIPIATGREAQLIAAEVQGGQAAVDIINALHTAAGLPAFSSADPAAIQAQVAEERRRELFLQGNRLYDVNRLHVNLTPVAGTAYPKGGTYGTTVCLPVPDIERLNNPNFPRT
jgi:hypothetical protein